MTINQCSKKTDIEPLVIEVIRELIKQSDFSNEIKTKIGKQFDNTTLDKELENYHSKLKETMQNKNRLEVEIDTLPLDARFRERKISDMTKRLDSLYDFIYEIESKIEDVKVSLKAVEEDTLTLEKIYVLLQNFDKLFDKSNDDEKKSLITSLIEAIEIFPHGESNAPLKSIMFKFPLYLDGEQFRGSLWDKSTTVSTCPARTLMISDSGTNPLELALIFLNCCFCFFKKTISANLF